MSDAEPNEMTGRVPTRAPVGEHHRIRCAGERRIGSINRARSLQSRISNRAGGRAAVRCSRSGFSAGTTCIPSRRRPRPGDSAQSDSQGKAQGDTALPSLGPHRAAEAGRALPRWSRRWDLRRRSRRRISPKPGCARPRTRLLPRSAPALHGHAEVSRGAGAGAKALRSGVLALDG